MVLIHRLARERFRQQVGQARGELCATPQDCIQPLGTEDATLVPDRQEVVAFSVRVRSRKQLRADKLRCQFVGRRPARRRAFALPRLLLGSEFDVDGHGGADLLPPA